LLLLKAKEMEGKPMIITKPKEIRKPIETPETKKTKKKDNRMRT
jgi:hypothetical protein